MSELINDAGRMAALFRGFTGGYGTYNARLLGNTKGKQIENIQPMRTERFCRSISHISEIFILMLTYWETHLSELLDFYLILTFSVK